MTLRWRVAETSTRVEFSEPSSLVNERDRPSDLRIVGNGPPGTFVVFPHGLKVSLPTDQIVSAHDSSGHASVAFGGMRFVGVQDGQLTFVREREMLPEEQLSPERSHVMRLDPAWVRSVTQDGQLVWSAAAPESAPNA